MTTNVLDRRNLRVTSDSRWSITKGEEIFFVDDTGFEKIVDRGSAVMICAGNAHLIEVWRRWFAGPMEEPKPPTSVLLGDGTFDTIHLTLVAKEGFQQFFTRGEYAEHGTDARFAGSGRIVARNCYSQNGCSDRCVGTASQFDPCTGGQVLFVNFSDGAKNLNYVDMSVSDLFNKLKTDGSVMNIRTKGQSKLSDLPADYLDNAVASGAYALSAPTGVPAQEWTAEEHDQLAQAIQRIRALEAEAAND